MVQLLPFYKLKTGPLFFFENLVLPAERKNVSKTSKNNQKQHIFISLKLVRPTMLRNILGPIFNLYLDQFLTFKIVFLGVFVLAETAIYSALSKKCKI